MIMPRKSKDLWRRYKSSKTFVLSQWACWHWDSETFDSEQCNFYFFQGPLGNNTFGRRSAAPYLAIAKVELAGIHTASSGSRRLRRPQREMSRRDPERLPMYASSESSTRRVRRSSQSSLSPSSSYNENLDHNHPSHTFTRSPTSSRQPRGRTQLPRFLRRRSLLTIVKYLFSLFLILLIYGYYTYELHVELALYSRTWVQKEIHSVSALSGCFDESRVSAFYNLTDAVYGPKRTEVQAGMPMRMGTDCYDFAGTIQSQNKTRPSSPVPPDERTQYHAYWRTDLTPFGPRQEWMLKSFFATQHLPTSRLTLWSNGDLRTNEILLGYLRQFPDSFALHIVDIPTLAKGTTLEGSRLLESQDKKAWVDGDLIRLLLLWNHGGVWVDMDSLLTRDLEPLLEHEFVTQWDCYGLLNCTIIPSLSDGLITDKKYQPLNGALMRFRKHSAYLCEAFHIMSTSSPPRSGSTDWGSLLYFKLWRALVAASIPPFKVLPFCFSDARSCRLDNRLPDPFMPDRGRLNRMGMWEGMGEGGKLDLTLKKVFGVHLHNQWEKSFPKGGWVERLLLRRYDAQLGRRDLGAEGT